MIPGPFEYFSEKDTLINSKFFGEGMTFSPFWFGLGRTVIWATTWSSLIGHVTYLRGTTCHPLSKYHFLTYLQRIEGHLASSDWFKYHPIGVGCYLFCSLNLSLLCYLLSY